MTYGLYLLIGVMVSSTILRYLFVKHDMVPDSTGDWLVVTIIFIAMCAVYPLLASGLLIYGFVRFVIGKGL